jgi:hypothetical protein
MILRAKGRAEDVLARPTWRELLLSRIDIPWEEELTAGSPASWVRTRVGQKAAWDLKDELFRWSDSREDVMTLEDALRGFKVLGATGGGKTTGAGFKVGKALLANGFGGLILCVKEDEAAYWMELARREGRLSDVRRITIDGAIRYNFLDAEAKTGGKMLTMNISELFSEVISLVNRTPKTPQKDPFWSDVLMGMLNHAIVLQEAAEGRVSVPILKRIITSAVPASESRPRNLPTALGQKPAEDPAQLYLKGLFSEARSKRPGDREVEQAIEFFSGEFVRLADKTRSIVVTTFTSMADALLREPLRSLLCEDTTAMPEEVFEGRIFIVDVPVHIYQRVGLVINLIWKTAFKRACQRRRTISTSRRPVFLWADESHYLFDQVDSEFQTTARSSLCCTVLLTQNLANYYAKIGDRASVQALLGSLHNKIYHQNNDAETNQFAAEAIGKLPIEVKSVTEGFGGKRSTTTSQVWDYDVPVRTFTNLGSGGWRNRFRVEGIVHCPGRKFSSGKTWLKASFEQKD